MRWMNQPSPGSRLTNAPDQSIGGAGTSGAGGQANLAAVVAATGAVRSGPRRRRTTAARRPRPPHAAPDPEPGRSDGWLRDHGEPAPPRLVGGPAHPGRPPGPAGAVGEHGEHDVGRGRAGGVDVVAVLDHGASGGGPTLCHLPPPCAHALRSPDNLSGISGCRSNWCPVRSGSCSRRSRRRSQGSMCRLTPRPSWRCAASAISSMRGLAEAEATYAREHGYEPDGFGSMAALSSASAAAWPPVTPARRPGAPIGWAASTTCCRPGRTMPCPAPRSTSSWPRSPTATSTASPSPPPRRARSSPR